jgi:hypothetical protein
MEVLHRGRRVLKPAKARSGTDPGGNHAGVETAMFTLPYNPIAVVPWIVGGLLSGLISIVSPLADLRLGRRISRSWHYGHAAPRFVRGRQ